MTIRQFRHSGFGVWFFAVCTVVSHQAWAEGTAGEGAKKLRASKSAPVVVTPIEAVTPVALPQVSPRSAHVVGASGEEGESVEMAVPLSRTAKAGRSAANGRSMR